MLDLKAKLLQAGLVTEDQVEKAQAEEEVERAKRKARREARDQNKGGKGGRGKGGPGRGGPGKGGAGKGPGKGGRGKGGPRKGGPPRGPGGAQSEAERWQKRVDKLKEAGKAEQYETIRKWVDKARLDPVKGMPSENADRYHFDKGNGAIGWLTLEPELVEKLKAGEAGIIAFMGFNGYAWCAVPRDLALDVHTVRPDWLRTLAKFEFEPVPLAATGKKAKKKDGEGKPEGDGAPSDAAGADGAEPVADGEPPTAEASSTDAPAEAPNAEAASGGEPAAAASDDAAAKADSDDAAPAELSDEAAPAELSADHAPAAVDVNAAAAEAHDDQPTGAPEPPAQ